MELSPDGRVFRWALAEKWLRIRWDRMVAAAKLTGTCKWMRRTGATWVEATQPGSASRFLGHRSPELAMKHYVDRTLLPNSCPMPPPIR
jgi:integrase